jgi:hypothetical protein
MAAALSVVVWILMGIYKMYCLCDFVSEGLLCPSDYSTPRPIRARGVCTPPIHSSEYSGSSCGVVEEFMGPRSLRVPAFRISPCFLASANKA